MTRLKKCLSFVVTFAIVFTVLAGCTRVSVSNREPNEYKITRIYEDGVPYFKLEPDVYYSCCSGVESISFASMDDFYRRVKTMDFTGDQIFDLRNNAWNDGRLPVFDVERLYLPVAPVTIEEKFSWYGGEYYFLFDFGKEHKATGGYISFCSDYYWESFFDTYVQPPPENSYYVRNAENGDYTATLYTYSTSNDPGHTWQLAQYQVTENGETVYISVSYQVPDDSQGQLPAWEMEGVYPYSVNIYGRLDGCVYSSVLSDLDFEPAIDWLLSFGAERYVPPQEFAALELVNEKAFPGEKVREENRAALEAQYGSGE